MAGKQQLKHSDATMYGTSIPADSTTHKTVGSVRDRITRERILDTLINTPYPHTADDIATRTKLPAETIKPHLNALTNANIATKPTDGSYTATEEDLPLAALVETGNTSEVFLLEARDKEYREWFGVDDPYEATQPFTADAETAIAALDQWFGIRKRLHQLADHPN